MPATWDARRCEDDRRRIVTREGERGGGERLVRTTLGSEVCLVYRDSGDFANIGVVEFSCCREQQFPANTESTGNNILDGLTGGSWGGDGACVSRWAGEALNRGVFL